MQPAVPLMASASNLLSNLIRSHPISSIHLSPISLSSASYLSVCIHHLVSPHNSCINMAISISESLSHLPLRWRDTLMVSDSAFLLLSRVEALLLEPSRNSQPSTLDKDSVVRLDAIDATWIELFNTPVVSEIPVPCW